MRTFVINLDSDVGRWNRYRSQDVVRVRACPREEVDSVTDERVVSRYNTRRDFHLGKCGCLISHQAVLDHIVVSKYDTPTLVLEDDAVVDEYCSELLEDYPKDHYIFLAGFFHDKKMMAKEVPKDIPRTQGLNKVDYNYFRIMCTQAYVIPNWEVAKKILDYYDSLKRWRAADVMLMGIPVPTLYQYPACFVEDSVESNINKKTKYSNAFYGRS
jgi:GR25 family glycosyltransferase involved in LPS biosynthesis